MYPVWPVVAGIAVIVILGVAMCWCFWWAWKDRCREDREYAEWVRQWEDDDEG